MKTTKITLTALGALAIFSTTSHAASRAEAYVGPLKYELTDLDAADGITPTLGLSMGAPSPRSSIGYAFAGTGNITQGQQTPDISSADIDFHISLPPTDVRSSLTGRSSPTTLETYAIGTVSNDIGSSWWNYTRAETYGKFEFVLSANSQAVFSFDSRLIAVIDGHDAAEQAYAVIGVGGAIYAGETIYGVGDSLIVQSQTLYPIDPNTVFNGVLTFTVTNTNSYDVLGVIGTTAIAQAAVNAMPVPEVPEPSTYGMLLVGLGLTGLAARRRKV